MDAAATLPCIARRNRVPIMPHMRKTYYASSYDEGLSLIESLSSHLHKVIESETVTGRARGRLAEVGGLRPLHPNETTQVVEALGFPAIYALDIEIVPPTLH
jgi:hypothetical protein